MMTLPLVYLATTKKRPGAAPTAPDRETPRGKNRNPTLGATMIFYATIAFWSGTGGAMIARGLLTVFGDLTPQANIGVTTIISGTAASIVAVMYAWSKITEKDHLYRMIERRDAAKDERIKYLEQKLAGLAESGNYGRTPKKPE